MVLESRRLHQITTHYPSLRGLMLLPFAPVFVAVFALLLVLPDTRAGLRTADEGRISLLMGVNLLLFCAALIVSLVFVTGYYDRRFGRVRPTRRTRILSGLFTGLVTLGVNLGWSFNMWMVMGLVPTPRVNIAALAIAAGCSFYWWVSGRFLNHYLFLALLGLLLGIAPWLGAVPVGGWWPSRVAALYLAVLCVVAGYFDHRTLARHMRSAPQASA